MSLILVSPASGTLNFGNVPVGGISNATITWTGSTPDMGNNSLVAPSGTLNGIATGEVISGANATQFSSLDSGVITVLSFTQVPDSFSTIQFHPSTTGPFTAQIVYTYAIIMSGSTTGPFSTSPIILTGVGVPTPAGGESPFLIQSFRRELVPVASNTGVIDLDYFNENNFNDANDNCGYTFKAEDIIADRVPTVRRVILTYIDLGLATLQFTLTGANDNGQIVTATKTQQIGNSVPTGLLLTSFIDISLTGFRPQLTINRAAGAGPIQISTVLITGTVETEVTL